MLGPADPDDEVDDSEKLQVEKLVARRFDEGLVGVDEVNDY